MASLVNAVKKMEFPSIMASVVTCLLLAMEIPVKMMASVQALLNQ